MVMASNGNIFRVTSPLCGEFPGPPGNFPHKGQWHGALMFSLICAWTNGLVNNRNVGDLRRHRSHYSATVMWDRSLTKVIPSPFLCCVRYHVVSYRDISRVYSKLMSIIVFELNSSPTQQNGRHFADDIFLMHFREWFICKFSESLCWYHPHCQGQ